MPKLLIICHSPSVNVQTLTNAVAAGARDERIEGVEVSVRSPFDTDAEHVQHCDGIILGTTENFGYMNGALKDFFERIYYPCLEQTQALPYALYVKGGQDGQGARASVERIVKGLRWRAVQPPLILRGPFDERWGEACAELGMTMAAGLAAGLF